MIAFLLWLILAAICWPLAIGAIILYPIVWFMLLPFRLVGIAVDSVLDFFRAVIRLPARVLGAGPKRLKAAKQS